MPYEIQLSKISELNIHLIWHKLTVYMALETYKAMYL